MKQAWFITAGCLVLVVGILAFPSTEQLDAAAKKKTKPKPVTKAMCLKSCESACTICTNNCDKKKTLKDQSDCVNKCVSDWYCCQDICYGTRKTCP